MTALLLASASPARLAVLRTAGLEPLVTVSGVDEDAVLAALADADAEERIRALAEAKADAVAARLATGALPGVAADDVVVVGCDSMLLIDGELQGKPDSPEQAKARWRQMAGRDGVLITGHAVRRVSDGSVAAEASDTRSTVVRMGRPTDAELDAYISTGEPMAVAGALTIDGFGGWFVDGVDGDPSNVLGLSLPLTRELLQRVGVQVTDLWRVPAPPTATQPTTTQPTATQPTATQPTATQSAATQPTATPATTTQSAAAQPATAQPTTAQSATAQSATGSVEAGRQQAPTASGPSDLDSPSRRST